MLLKKVLKGHFRIRGISVHSPEDVNPGNFFYEKCEITFHRQGRWSIFGWREHRNRSYVRKDVSKYVEIFRYKTRRCYPFGFYGNGGKNWLLQFYTADLSEIVLNFLVNNILWIYMGMLLVKYLLKELH